MLLRIGEVYRYSIATDNAAKNNGAAKNSAVGLRYYGQANALLHPGMKDFRKFRGKCYASMGYMYYWLGEYSLAEQHTRQGFEMLDQDEANWVYQTCKQHFGRALICVGQYDRAYEMLESTANAAVLQSPYYQIRSFWTLSDLFFSIGETEKGLEFAENAELLCKTHALPGQRQILKNVLARHQVLLEHNKVC